MSQTWVGIQSAPISRPSANTCLALVVKNYSKAYIKVSWSCP